ncbi:MAG: aspartate kinase [Bacteroidetes bacterium]|jgi:aspartate kinase|nr:aspartate kinase [Bacteroidota bacterium]MBT3748895.1 aspartate kinase [Bacteroidota bacterium]MBT4398369.1 aspartate kinase [Bacteroidota bacterium]MBT4409410.1 aspartate kinase [Bacteroidota bacterium]MBT5425331.1 aspartate kinase [Bacteroidota bacterium]
MIVLKFGGTSLGSTERIKSVGQLIRAGGRKIVVLSAISGTTNLLEKYAHLLYKNENTDARELLESLKSQYLKTVGELFSTEEHKKKGQELISHHFDYLESFNRDLFTLYEEKAVLAQGELISTALMNFYLEESGCISVLLPALSFMRIDKDHEPDLFYIRENIKREIGKSPECNIFITQGFICRDAFGEVDNLKRGGSDYSASLIGQALDAQEIQIWTDIDGFHNNDPRFVSSTKRIDKLSFDEAAELAYFGAKILHPTSVKPAQMSNIPVRLKNTLDPESPGTIITASTDTYGRIKAVAAKDGITSIRIKSGRMLLAYGFLRKVFEIFERHQTAIDMITTSEVSVSVTIDDDKHIDEIENDLRKYGTVELMPDQSIVCVVGDLIAESSGMARKVIDALHDIPIRMISYGSSSNNISLLINTDNKEKALNELSNHLFQ